MTSSISYRYAGCDGKLVTHLLAVLPVHIVLLLVYSPTTQQWLSVTSQHTFLETIKHTIRSQNIHSQGIYELCVWHRYFRTSVINELCVMQVFSSCRDVSQLTFLGAKRIFTKHTLQKNFTFKIVSIQGNPPSPSIWLHTFVSRGCKLTLI